MEIKSLKKVWVCVDRDGNPNYNTISYNKKYSIKYFLDGVGETWDVYRKKYGWKCVKVNINFESVI